MKKIILILAIPIILILNNEQKEVFICKGKSSKKYHLDKNCRGLKNCSTKIYKVKLQEALKMKRTLCGWED